LNVQALGKIMGKELPKVPGGSNVVLYPASVRAGTDLQNSLTESGFTVQRLHTYDTVSACPLPGGCLVHCAPSRGAKDFAAST
jgi:uroporphyrinogen-III synthase